MIRILALVFLIFIAVKTRAASLSATVHEIALKESLVRAGLPLLCPIKAELLPFAEAQFDLEADNALKAVKPADWSVAEWRRLSRADCVKDCTCSALTRAFERRPESMKGFIAVDWVKRNLDTMTDKSYLKCFQDQKDFCHLPLVKTFLAALRKKPSPEIKNPPSGGF